MAATKKNPKTGRTIGAEKEKGGQLTTAGRLALPKKTFALPPSKEEKARGIRGSYPLPDEAHARSALSRVSAHGTAKEKAEVRAKVAKKFPSIEVSKKK